MRFFISKRKVIHREEETKREEILYKKYGYHLIE